MLSHSTSVAAAGISTGARARGRTGAALKGTLEARAVHSRSVALPLSNGGRIVCAAVGAGMGAMDGGEKVGMSTGARPKANDKVRKKNCERMAKRKKKEDSKSALRAGSEERDERVGEWNALRVCAYPA